MSPHDLGSRFLLHVLSMLLWFLILMPHVLGVWLHSLYISTTTTTASALWNCRSWSVSSYLQVADSQSLTINTTSSNYGFKSQKICSVITIAHILVVVVVASNENLTINPSFYFIHFFLLSPFNLQSIQTPLDYYPTGSAVVLVSLPLAISYRHVLVVQYLQVAY